MMGGDSDEETVWEVRKMRGKVKRSDEKASVMLMLTKENRRACNLRSSIRNF
jgi:hypothetical protein